MTKAQQRQLNELGWVALPGVMDSEFLREARDRVEQLWELEGENAGSEFRKEPGARRLANLVDKGAVFERVVSQPDVLAAVGLVLGPDFKLSSLNARSTDPWWNESQPLHCDTGAVADDKGFSVCNTIWLLDDFTPENGPTRIVPGTHYSRKLPQDVLADPQAPHPEEILVLGKAGSVIVMNTHAWHGEQPTGRPSRGGLCMRSTRGATNHSSSIRGRYCDRRRRRACRRNCGRYWLWTIRETTNSAPRPRV